MIFPLLCIFIGLQLLLSGLIKFRDFSTFLTIFNSYPITKVLKKRFFAYLIVAAEILIGISLLSFNGKIIWLGLLITAVFISIATVLVAIRLKKGEKKFRCGCGESLTEEQNATWLITRNFALIILIAFGLNENVAAVSLFSKEAFYVFLSGCGLLTATKLVFAGFKGISYIRVWKVAG